MFELLLDPASLALLCGVAFVAGFIDAVAGGGGLLTVPAFLTTGLPAHIALGTNKLAASFGSLTTSITFYRKRLFDPLFWRYCIAATATGALIGTLVADTLSVETLNKLIPLIILATAIYTLLNRFKPDVETDLPAATSKNRITQCVQGLILGWYDGLIGPGTGAFWTVSNSMLYKMNLLLSSGLARSMNFVSNAVSLATFFYLGYVNIVIGVAMGSCLMIGAYLGAHSAIRFGSKFIRPIFITVVSIMAVNLAYRAWL